MEKRQLIEVILVLALTGLVRAQNNYCAISVNHTMCRYQAKACTKPNFSSGMTEADRKAVVAAHNELRAKVANGKQSGQPQASNMYQLQYNLELETIAQRWCDQCNFGHDAIRSTITNMYCGQNAALTGSTVPYTNGYDLAYATKLWFNEVTTPGFNPSNISPFKFDSGNGHYTQVVWAETKTIGCGASTYYDGKYYRQYYVCNYGPGGNYQQATMYKVGTAASACPGAKSTEYPGLCM